MTQLELMIRSNEALPLSPSVRVACQGVAGAFSHAACRSLFAEPEACFFPSFEEVFEAVSSENCRYGVVPIENTLAGSVTDNYDLMLRYQLSIVGTVALKIEHSLLALPHVKLSDLKEVYSHEQALYQCSDFLKANPNLSLHPYSNTAASAKFVAQTQNPALAAIGSEESAERYGLSVLKKAIQNRDDNFTRFVVLSRNPISHPGCNRISMVVRLRHQAGALYRALSCFAGQNINLLKLESRPIPERPFEFLFYWDFSGNLSSPKVRLALDMLQNEIEYQKLLGNYPDFQQPSLSAPIL